MISDQHLILACLNLQWQQQQQHWLCALSRHDLNEQAIAVWRAQKLFCLQLGKGKWKKILDEAGDVFKSRSQVDLKDKWRNLERQGIVQAPVKQEPASGTVTMVC